MSETKYRAFSVTQGDIDIVLNKCDLGDWRNIQIAAYPHKSTLTIKFIEHAALTDLQAKYDFLEAQAQQDNAYIQDLLHQLNSLSEEIDKLKSLILLTDPAVSNVEMNELTAKQWIEFKTWKQENDK